MSETKNKKSSKSLTIIIVEKLGNLKPLSIKEFNTEDLYKKCGFKKDTDFTKQIEWSITMDKQKYFIELYAKADGRATTENKYEFPPPVDDKLFFGSCAIVAYLKNEDHKVYIDLSVALWEKMYEKLYGGFEDLAACALEDENEEDELANIPAKFKTKQGYLKDGFVIDNSDEDELDTCSYISGSEGSVLDDEKNGLHNDTHSHNQNNSGIEDLQDTEDIGSELSEEDYDYDD